MQERYVAYSTTDVPYPAKTFEGMIDPIPYEELAVQEGTFPIAETSTLPPGYYATTHLDTRFPSDRRRVEVFDSVRSLEEALQRVRRLLGSVATEVLDPWRSSSIPIESMVERYDVRNHEELVALSVAFLKVPTELRAVAYQDPITAFAVMDVIGSIRGLYDIADSGRITARLQSIIRGVNGKERIRRIEQSKTAIEAEIAEQIERETLAVQSGSDEGLRLQEQRIARKRFIADGIDGTLFRSGSNSGTIVDPSYLVDDTYYESLKSEPEVPFEYKVAFLKHMMAGHWALGQDHTFVYRNNGDGMAATQTGVVPDYAAVRPGNFLYHDLKLLEHGPFKQKFPTRILYEYVRNHYLRQMDLAVIDVNNGASLRNTVVNQYFVRDNVRYVIPLKRDGEHVVPFRALKKYDNDPQYYEYGQECYMAELVDIALQLDAIEQRRGESKERAVFIGDVAVGNHVWDLIADLYHSAEGSVAATALAVEQVLFMNGRAILGGRQTVEAILLQGKGSAGLSSMLTAVTSVQEYTPEGAPQPSRLPLTCYYEWFLRFARPINKEEMRHRGVAILEPILKE